jgi:drug/metabolite transporter (DMT)-like permease
MVSFEVSWFVAAVAGMLSFACMSLTLKKLTYLLPTPVVLLYVFAITGTMYLVLGIKRGLQFNVGWQAIGLLGLASLFAFIGNLADLEALRLAPNPGFASAVKAGQIIVITFAALLLFPDQKLTFQGICGVLLVFCGILLLALQK